MLLDIRDLKNGRVDTIKEEFNQPLVSLALSSLQVGFVDSPAVEVTAYRNGSLVHVAGKLEAKLSLLCARCLEPFELSFADHFQAAYSLDGENNGEDVEPLTGNKIELDPLVTDSLILALPMKALCSENCQGLCLVCGQNLNEKDCGCDRRTIDPRFADLKKLFQKQ